MGNTMLSDWVPNTDNLMTSFTSMDKKHGPHHRDPFKNMKEDNDSQENEFDDFVEEVALESLF